MLSPMTAGVTLFVAVLIFGPKNLPLLARNAGQALGEFKSAMSGGLQGEAVAPPAVAAPAASRPLPPLPRRVVLRRLTVAAKG